MKIRSMLLSFLAGAIVLFFVYGYSRAGSEPAKVAPKIGVVSIQRVFQQCKRNAEYTEETNAEQAKIIAELDKLSKAIEADRAGLKTLKAGSSDYLALMREILEKQAKLQAQTEFHKQHMTLKDQRWTEQLYQDILRITGKVAEEKGLGLVFEKDEIELPAVSANDLMLIIRTHKLLYCGGCLDISDEVIAQLDAGT